VIDNIEEENKEYAKLARNLIRIVATPIPKDVNTT
jgi:hypothetical protein